MTRDEILEAAAQIFRQKGFHAASMQDIAQAVNLQKASLYHHVTSKQDILLALLDRALDMLIQQIEAILVQPFSADQKLRLAIHAYLHTMLEYSDLAAVLLLEYRSLEPQFHAQHMPRRDRFERLWRDLIQSGMEQGVFECGDAALAARAVLGVLNWTITWYRPGGALSPEDIAGQYAGMFLNGIKKDG
ncbi:MAG: TetR/AcrR family transcriptional regulator [Chloroflexi bacterium]|nr:TetR/AcrR family transcriptional regulator [Chloroflexota bacterium]